MTGLKHYDIDTQLPQHPFTGSILFPLVNVVDVPDNLDRCLIAIGEDMDSHQCLGAEVSSSLIFNDKDIIKSKRDAAHNNANVDVYFYSPNR